MSNSLSEMTLTSTSTPLSAKDRDRDWRGLWRHKFRLFYPEGLDFDCGEIARGL